MLSLLVTLASALLSVTPHAPGGNNGTPTGFTGKIIAQK